MNEDDKIVEEEVVDTPVNAAVSDSEDSGLPLPPENPVEDGIVVPEGSGN